ncbi:hypothetical protein F2P81_020287 [Scophthalmus maximus]|uniref:Uncharacterized protein n=1 Tax=Scophthalmus maximus TaxID=52904 RepID=A0A6A4RXJ8_SCOMX|nr:hypothetical protein F2P81_020287 [Scophthalmus maximus]
MCHMFLAEQAAGTFYQSAVCEWKDKMNESTGNDTTIQIPHNHPRILEQRLSRDDMYMQATPGYRPTELLRGQSPTCTKLETKQLLADWCLAATKRSQRAEMCKDACAPVIQICHTHSHCVAEQMYRKAYQGLPEHSRTTKHDPLCKVNGD